MNSRKTPKTHLVPVIKGVSDPAKGLIFRTYHVRPEQLHEALKKSTSIPDKLHIDHIKNYNNLSKSIDTNDITYLKNMFSENSKVWESVVHRNIKEDKSSTNIEKQKFFQSVFAHILSQNHVFCTCMKKHMRKASVKKQVNVTYREKTNVNKYSKSQNIFEKYTYEPTLDTTDYIKPVTLPISKKKDVLHVTNIDIDYGKVLYTDVVEEVISNHIDLAKELSIFINFINPSSVKATSLYSNLIGKSNEGNIVARNLIFKPYVYKSNLDYWTPLLSSNIYNKYANSTESSDEALFYNSAILKSINNKRFLAIAQYIDDKKIQKLASGNFSELFNSDELSVTDKSLYITSLNKEEFIKNKKEILSKIVESYKRNNTDSMFKLLSAYSNHVDSNIIYRTINTHIPSLLSVDNIMYNTLYSWKNTPYNYLLLQLLFSRLSKNYYVPYNDTAILGDMYFLPNMIVKLFKEILSNKLADFSLFIKANNRRTPDILKIGMKKNNDSTKFVRMHPLMLMDIVEGSNEEYLFTGTINKKDIVLLHEDKLLVYNPINSITFD